MSVEGVTESVQAAMAAANANVLTGDGLLQRTCEHGIRHPVGHLDRKVDIVGENVRRRHETRGRFGGAVSVQCCGCCATW